MYFHLSIPVMTRNKRPLAIHIIRSIQIVFFDFQKFIQTGGLHLWFANEDVRDRGPLDGTSTRKSISWRLTDHIVRITNIS